MERFRQILIWPLALARPLDSPPDWTPAAAVHKQAEDLEGRWSRVQDGLDHLDGGDEAQKYEEFVYFHDFIADVLYRKLETSPNGRDAENGLMGSPHIFRRGYVQRVSITLPDGDGRFELTVDRVRLSR